MLIVFSFLFFAGVVFGYCFNDVLSLFYIDVKEWSLITGRVGATKRYCVCVWGGGGGQVKFTYTKRGGGQDMF